MGFFGAKRRKCTPKGPDEEDWMGNLASTEICDGMDGPPPKRRKTRSDLSGALQRVASKSTKVTRKPKVAQEEWARAVRPRPLHVNDKIRVLWQGRDAEWDELDGGAFAEWVQSCEDELQWQKSAQGKDGVTSAIVPQVVVVGHSFKALPEDAQGPGAAHVSLPAPAALEVGAAEPIDVPKCRQLSKSQKSGGNDADDSEDSVEPGYVRFVNAEGDGTEGAVEYDMDEEDEAWLSRHLKQGPRSQRSLTEDVFESLMNHFEKALHAAIQQRTDMWQTVTGPSTETPDVQALYPLEDVFQSQELAHVSRPIVEAVYAHWCKKRRAAKRPLLQRLWFEQPWVRMRDASKEAWPGAHNKSGAEAELPFMGQDSPLKPNTRPRKINAEEALYRLESIRGDLETIRTMADQVRRREKLHKRELLQWRRDWSARLSTADGVASSEGPVEVPPSVAQQELPPDREARLASRAATQAAREAATLIGAQVVMAPSGCDDHTHGRHRAPRAAPDASPATASPPRSEVFQPGPHHTQECFWCKGDHKLLGCSSCPRCYCFYCYKQRPGYGIVNWGKILRASEFECPVCSGKDNASSEGDAVPGAQRIAQVARIRAKDQPKSLPSMRGRGNTALGRSTAASRKLRADAPPAQDSKPALPEPEVVASTAAVRPETAQPSQAALVKRQPPQRKQQQKAQQKGRKQHQAVVREGLRHTKQNYEKLAGVKHTRKAASKKRLAVPVRKVSPKAKAQPKPRGDSKAPSQPTKPAAIPLPEPAPKPAKPTLKPAEAKPPEVKEQDSDRSGMSRQVGGGKAAAAKEMTAEDVAQRPTSATQAQKAAAKAVKVAVVRGRASRRGGHLRQGSTGRAPPVRPGAKETATVPAAAAVRKPERSEPRDVGSWETGIPGIRRVLRSTGQARRAVRTEYVMTCGEHASFRHDRVPRMVNFFQQHSSCQPAWSQLAQQPRESRAACEKRLRAIFSFSCLQGSGPAPITLITSKSKAAAQPSKPSTQAAQRAVSGPSAGQKAAAADKCRQQAGSSKPSCNASVRRLQQAGGYTAPAPSALGGGGKPAGVPRLPIRAGKGSDTASPAPLKCVLDRRSITDKGTNTCSSRDTRLVAKRGPKPAASDPTSQRSAGCSKCRFKSQGCGACNPNHSSLKPLKVANGGVSATSKPPAGVLTGKKRSRA